MSICGSCGKSSVETVEHNGEVQRVCTSCGVIEESGSFSTDAETSSLYVDQRNALFANQKIPTEIQRRSKVSLSEGRKEGFGKITVLASQFRLTTEMKNQAFDLFKRAIASKGQVMCRVKKKILIAGCCVYAVMRERSWPVTVSHICNALGCSRTDFSKPYFKLQKVLQIPISSVPIEELVDSFINSCKELDSSEKPLLTSRVLAILNICKECWLTSGRMQRPVLLAALYISWQSLDSKRSKITLSTFCSKMNFTYQVQAGSRKCELLKVLCALANQIPWFETDHVTSKNLYKYLEEIIQYSEALLCDLGSESNNFRKFLTKRKTVQVETTHEKLDISEEEIDSYIRSEKEVELIQNMNQTFET